MATPEEVLRRCFFESLSDISSSELVSYNGTAVLGEAERNRKEEYCNELANAYTYCWRASGGMHGSLAFVRSRVEGAKPHCFCCLPGIINIRGILWRSRLRGE